MIVDVTAPLLMFDGTPVERPGKDDKMEPVLIRDVIAEILQSQVPATQPGVSPPPPGAADLARCGGLTAKVYTADKVKLSAKDVTFILEWSGKVNYSTLWNYRLQEAIDPDSLADAGTDDEDDEKADPEGHVEP